MVEEKLPQQIYNVLEKSYKFVYHVVFLEACKSYEITPISSNIEKTSCVGKPSKNFLLLLEKELAVGQFKLIELTIIESVQKLSDLGTEFISKFSLYAVQENWLLKKRNHLEKYENKLRLKKLKKIIMLASTDDLCFACLERLESHYRFFRLKSRFFNFCKSSIPDFENLHYLLDLNELEDDVSEEKDFENDCSVEIRDVNTSSLDSKLNVKENATNMLDIRLQGNFVSKNVANLSKRNLAGYEPSLLSKDLILFRLLIQ